MSKTIFDIANSCKLHPSDIILRLSHLGCTFNDIWPIVNDIWYEELKKSYWKIFGLEKVIINSELPSLSKTTLKILDKLDRNQYWGAKTIFHDHLRLHLCNNPPDFNDSIKELYKNNLLSTNHSNKDKISLGPKKKKDIDLLLRDYRKILH
ncbi:MAG: hypothetical protein A2X61_16435 [Ignavibacteria bacterium GWB2_35_12]|nr:MAG: hypothetical protein A2X61_16435 [Ignavibacteria bacterium GWB2_35_12]OGU94049.1 MAG: hypothetical protein A2220_07635 [Ignavibacteria bacterium RIFOXYA2_FULL_35_10]OGV23593.1 MAG: hypothetical protein A2475_07750 [Ignavibacteria bacterium RIFOXYC2_FULL_35_21]